MDDTKSYIEALIRGASHLDSSLFEYPLFMRTFAPADISWTGAVERDAKGVPRLDMGPVVEQGHLAKPRLDMGPSFD